MIILSSIFQKLESKDILIWSLRAFKVVRATGSVVEMNPEVFGRSNLKLLFGNWDQTNYSI
jgi:hypothetical protein